jgi:hypothetical protein
MKAAKLIFSQTLKLLPDCPGIYWATRINAFPEKNKFGELHAKLFVVERYMKRRLRCRAIDVFDPAAWMDVRSCNITFYGPIPEPPPQPRYHTKNLHLS